MMDHTNPVSNLLARRRDVPQTGIPSFCTANERVLTAILRAAAGSGRLTLIEATANQVNQFGGYTGMRPRDFANLVLTIAKKVDCDASQIILGGDHLGPLTFAKETVESAMEKAEELVSEYVLAGFSKIHLDTSMKLGDDGPGALEKSTVAKRGARLCCAAEKAFEQYASSNRNAIHPIYIIGSEVPIPGGAQAQENSIAVTSVKDCRETIETYRTVFSEYGLDLIWKHVVGIVVQPGVEFGDNVVFPYQSENAAALMRVLKEHPSLVFEGHSTDYQSDENLRRMVRDGIAILKVGPELTFALRESLFALSNIEAQLLPEEKRTKIEMVLEHVMKQNPTHWRKYYSGSKGEQMLARRYSLSDRARYYIGSLEVENSVSHLIQQINNTVVPAGLVHQFFPEAEFCSKESVSQDFATALIESRILKSVNRYYAACGL